MAQAQACKFAVAARYTGNEGQPGICLAIVVRGVDTCRACEAAEAAADGIAGAVSAVFYFPVAAVAVAVAAVVAAVAAVGTVERFESIITIMIAVIAAACAGVTRRGNNLSALAVVGLARLCQSLDTHLVIYFVCVSV